MNQVNNDTVLWNECRNGNANALAELFQNHFSEMFNFGKKIVADEEVIKDCIQDLFVEIWKQKNKLLLVSVKAYFIKSLQYKLIKIKKRQTKQQPFNINEDWYFEWGSDNFLIQQEEASISAKKLIDAMRLLPKRQQEILYLKFQLNLSYEEICEVMNIQYQVARNQISNAMKFLKGMLAP